MINVCYLTVAQFTVYSKSLSLPLILLLFMQQFILQQRRVEIRFSDATMLIGYDGFHHFSSVIVSAVMFNGASLQVKVDQN